MHTYRELSFAQMLCIIKVFSLLLLICRAWTNFQKNCFKRVRLTCNDIVPMVITFYDGNEIGARNEKKKNLCPRNLEKTRVKYLMCFNKDI